MENKLPSRALDYGAVLVPLILGVACALWSVQMGLGTLSEPGAGMWPLVASVVLVGASMMSLLSVGRGHERYVENFSGAGLRYVAYAIVVMAGFAVVYGILGLTSTVLVALLIWFRFISHEPWAISILGSIACAASFHFIFRVFLNVPAPVNAIIPL